MQKVSHSFRRPVRNSNFRVFETCVIQECIAFSHISHQILLGIRANQLMSKSQNYAADFASAYSKKTRKEIQFVEKLNGIQKSAISFRIFKPK